MSIQVPENSAMHGVQYGAGVMNDMQIAERQTSRTAATGGWTAYCAAVLVTKDEPNFINNQAAYPASEMRQEGHDASRRV